jgi:N-acetylglucosamine-6-phosphate deacetylase
MLGTAPVIILFMKTLLTAERLWDGSRFLQTPFVVVENGVVVAMASRSERELPAGGQRIDLAGATLAPAFFDVHIHGAAGHDVMEATSEALNKVGRFLASRGTGQYLATTVTAGIDETLRSLEGLARLMETPREDGCARPIGIHLEGPFLSHIKRGVHPPEKLREPSIELFDRFFEAAGGHVKLMTLAPELPGANELARHACERGVRISMGHSNATAAETRKTIAAGATSATHTFNAMRALDQREPGILGVVLSEESLYAELICDGVHTAPEIVRLWWKAKGSERALLVTDAMSAAGMPNGEYRLGGFPVQVADGKAMSGGALAGSVLTLDRALSNFLTYTGAALEDGLGLLTRNPAAMTGLDVASLHEGCKANLVAVDTDGNLTASFVNGLQAATN